jgi:two-component system NarL family response regulator
MSTPARIRILVADDHPVTREGLALVLATQPDMEVVAQAADGAEAVELYARHRPDVALLDVQMPRASGVAATETITGRFPEARVLLFTTFDGQEDVHRGLRAGARGYLLKESPSAELFAAIRALHLGSRYVSPQVGARLAEHFEADRLTERQLDVLRLVAAGQANKQIADSLGIGEGTVKTHVNALLAKLGAASRTEAVVFAQKRGWLRA